MAAKGEDKMKRLAYYLRVYKVQIKNNFVREAVYRTNFFSMVAVDLIWLFVELSFFTIIYANVDSLAGWTLPQVYFFLGVFFASDSIFTAFFQRNFWEFSDLQNHGGLDILLTKPIQPLFLALTRYINLTGGLNVLLGILIMIRYAGPAGFEGGLSWLLVLFWLAFGVASALAIRFLVAVFVFWTERGFGLSYLYYQLFALASRPDSIYPKAMRYAIMTLLPFAFIGSVPARAILGKISITEIIWVLGVLILFVVMDVILWGKALKRYQSASS